MEKKTTQREMFNEIIAMAQANNRQDIVTFCEGRIEQIDKKNASATSKPKKVTEEQETMRNAIVAYLSTVERASVAEIMVAIGASSNQKVTGNVKRLNTLGIIADPVKEKKVSYWSLAK